MKSHHKKESSHHEESHESHHKGKKHPVAEPAKMDSHTHDKAAKKHKGK